MARIAGVDLPRNKHIVIALTGIYGIGKSRSMDIISEVGLNPTMKADELTEEQVNEIRKVIDSKYKVEGELRAETSMNIKRLMDLGCYRGLRHRNPFLVVVREQALMPEQEKVQNVLLLKRRSKYCV